MDSTVRVVAIGACGRMGKLVCELASSTTGFELVGAVEAKGHPSLGQSVFGTTVTESLPSPLPRNSVGVCFTNAEGLLERLGEAQQAGLPMVIGTTGLTDEQKKALESAAAQIPVVYAPNFSLGVNVLLVLAQQAARLLKEFEAEVFEVHHSGKRDAPSGTALALGEAVASARGMNLSDVAVFGRATGKPRSNQAEIGFSVMRAGDVVGEHELTFFGRFERVYLGHKAHSRAVFAQGALAAAKWLLGKPAGLYSMKDVLGL